MMAYALAASGNDRAAKIISAKGPLDTVVAMGRPFAGANVNRASVHHARMSSSISVVHLDIGAKNDLGSSAKPLT
jgi:hypothetical protein